MKSRNALVFAVLVVCAAPAFSAYDAFMKIGDIKGESQQQDHKNWIEISSFSFGVTHAGSVATRSGRTTSPRQTTATVRARVGAYLSQLQLAAASGRPFQSAIVDIASQRYTLENVLVSSVASNSIDSSGVPEMTLTLAFTHYSMSFTPRPSPNHASKLATPLTVNPALAPPNAQVSVNGVPGDRFDLLGLRFTGEHDGVLTIRESPNNTFFQQAKGKTNPKVSVQKQYMVITLTDCLVTSYSRSADGTSTIGIHFTSYQGPVGGYHP